MKKTSSNANRVRHWALPLLLSIACLLALELVAHADHGPGTSGGGTSTQSAQTLAPNTLSFEYRSEYTEFKQARRSEVLHRAEKAGSFDALARSFLHKFSADFGLAEDLQVGLTLGYYDATGTREGEFEADEGELAIHDFDPDGLTDLWVRGKFRFCKGPEGQVAVFGGVKFPTGKFRIKNDAGEFIEPSATPGTGAYDVMVGLAFSRWLTEQISMDASAQYTRRGQRNRFKLGDRIDAGVAVNVRLTEAMDQYPRTSLFVEAIVRHLLENQDRGSHDSHTGGTALFLSPGIRVDVCENVAITLAPQFPAVQNLNGEQQETDIKVVSAVTVTF